MERGESSGATDFTPPSSSATAAEAGDAQASGNDEPAFAKLGRQRSTSSARRWRLRQEIPRSDSRGPARTYDEGGVRVEEGVDGRIHVIRDSQD